MIQVSDVMSRNVVTIGLSKVVLDAARIMTEKKIGGLIVVNKQKPMGVVTESDLVRNVLAKNLDPTKIKVSDLLDRELISIKPNATLQDAVNLMVKNSIRRLPVIQDGKLIGIVTILDLAKQMTDYPQKANLADIVNYWFKREENRKNLDLGKI